VQGKVCFLSDFYRIRRVFKENDSRRQYPGARAALKDDAIPDIPVVVNDDSPAPKKPRKTFQKRRKNDVCMT
jgi:hypothetical protein